MAIDVVKTLSEKICSKDNKTPNTTPAPKTEKTVSDSGGNGSTNNKSSTNFVDDTLSVFENDTNPNKTTTRTQKTQEQIIADLKAAGLVTTKIHNGETDFSQYTAALSDELKKEIVDSYDTEADYILQQEILGMYTKKHSFRNGDFASAMRKMGYQVSRKSVKTTYLTDWKKGKGSTLRTGHLSVYTVTDPKTGAEIKIADTNGNGEIEIEEVVANEFLTGIASQIDISNFKSGSASATTTGGSSQVSSSSGLTGSLKGESSESTYRGGQRAGNSSKTNQTEDGRIRLNAKQYEMLKEKIAKYYTENKGYDESVANAKARMYMQEKVVQSEEAMVVGNLEGLAMSMVNK